MPYNVANNLRVAMPDAIGVDQLKRKNAMADMAMQNDQQRNALYGQQIQQNESRMQADQQAAAIDQVKAWAPGAIAQVEKDPTLLPQFLAAGQRLGVFDPNRTPDTVTPQDVAQLKVELGLMPAQEPAPVEAQSIGGFRVLMQGGKPVPGGVQAPERPQTTPQPKDVNRQLVTRPTPDGRQQDYAFNPQTAQLEPVGQPYDKTAPLSPKDTGVVKQKLIQISTARRQLATAKEKWKALQNSLSAGPGGGFLPTPAGKAFDAAIDGMRGSITALTRVPGVGAMSDYETRLDQAKFPERGNYEEVTAQKLDQLDALINGLDTGYRDLLGGTSDTAAPAAAAPTDGVVTVTSPAEAMKLPPGTKFKTPDGRVKVR